MCPSFAQVEKFLRRWKITMCRQTNNFALAAYIAISSVGTHGCILVMLPSNDFHLHSIDEIDPNNMERICITRYCKYWQKCHHINIIMLRLLINMDIYILQGCGWSMPLKQQRFCTKFSLRIGTKVPVVVPALTRHLNDGTIKCVQNIIMTQKHMITRMWHLFPLFYFRITQRIGFRF